jgi:hypothetical protein
MQVGVQNLETRIKKINDDIYGNASLQRKVTRKHTLLQRYHICVIGHTRHSRRESTKILIIHCWLPRPSGHIDERFVWPTISIVRTGTFIRHFYVHVQAMISFSHQEYYKWPPCKHAKNVFFMNK